MTTIDLGKFAHKGRVWLSLESVVKFPNLLSRSRSVLIGATALGWQ